MLRREVRKESVGLVSCCSGPKAIAGLGLRDLASCAGAGDLGGRWRRAAAGAAEGACRRAGASLRPHHNAIMLGQGVLARKERHLKGRLGSAREAACGGRVAT